MISTPILQEIQATELRAASSSGIQRNEKKRLFSEKIKSLPELLDETHLKKKQHSDHLIVFTNGCFDLLHEGHVTYLEKAALLGQTLIVGLNTDASIRRLNKSAHRPICEEKSRAIVLASLESVDAVILFDEDTPLKLIQAIRPDILVKGSDYTVENIIGAQEVLTWQGEVKTIPLVSGFSTTQLLKKIHSTL